MRDEHVFNIKLSDVLRAVKRRFYVPILVMIPVMLLSIYYSQDASITLYETNTSLIIGNNMDNKSTKFSIDDALVVPSFMQTYSVIAKTSVVSEKTIQKLNLKISPEVLKSRINCIPIPETQFMQLKLIWPDPKEAMIILDAFIETYIEEARNIYPTYNMRVMEKEKQARPIPAPDKKKYIFIGLLGGIVISLLIIFAMEFMNSKLRTEEDIEEYLHLPVVGLTPKERRKGLHITLSSLEKLHYGVQESYKTLRTNVYFTSIDVRTIIVTSPSPGEGKTTVASMLAVVLAQDGKKTILIDCDLRKPNVHKVFNLPERGLANILSGGIEWSDKIHQSEIENLYILTAGFSPPNPSELLSSAKMKELMEGLQSDFDYIILDTPPIGLVTDAQVLSQFADRYLLVVSSGKSRKEEALKTKRLIQYVEGKILGIVLNKVKDSTPPRYYRHYRK